MQVRRQQEPASAGLAFVRKLDMKTGWIFRIVHPVPVADHEVQLALGFQDDALKTASFGFAENRALDMDALFNVHNAFLHRQLGQPHSQNNRRIRYEYGWGEIVSELDPRESGSSIWVRRR